MMKRLSFTLLCIHALFVSLQICAAQRSRHQRSFDHHRDDHLPSARSAGLSWHHYLVTAGAGSGSAHNRRLSSLGNSGLKRRANTTKVVRSAFSNRKQARQNTDQDEMDVVYQRRVTSIISSLTVKKDSISNWLSSLGADGKWPDSEIDYTTGCAARRANWPAQDHWARIVIMAAAWHGGLNGAVRYNRSPELLNATLRAMDYWFARDFTNDACLDKGGKAECPCENPNNWLWNTNWFSNVILIPRFVGQACVLLGNDTLTPSQREVAVRMMSRSFNYNVDGMTGANALDVSRIGMDLALVTSNANLLNDAYGRAHKELIIMNKVRADGIRADGSFGQHDGMLYNGNYGKDYVNSILGIELEAAGTQFAANPVSKDAFGTLMDGDRWMIYSNSITKVLHWDFSVLGRFISFPVADKQATGSIKINLTAVGELGRRWQSQSLMDFEQKLSQDSRNANAGSLVGNRMFYTNDYMVHRGLNYVSTLKMWSLRTRHTECTNSQNPLGFHLADGVLYTYLQGNEYEDIAAAWDWDLIPGITTDYGATPLTCQNTKLLGVEGFVGGASNGRIGVAAMRYTNPATKSLSWQKAWFFLPNDVQHVVVSNVRSSTAAPVLSVLDQRRRAGPVIVDGVPVVGQGKQTYEDAMTLWHGGVGYVFGEPSAPGTGMPLVLDLEAKEGNWSKIGISTQPPSRVDLFAAWIPHASGNGSLAPTPVAYTVLPGVTIGSFEAKRRELKLRSVQSDASVSAVYDESSRTFMGVFWDAKGGSVTSPLTAASSLAITVDGNAAVLFDLASCELTVSDPSQTLSSLGITLEWSGDVAPGSCGGNGGRRQISVELPQGGLAGKSVTRKI